MNAVERIEAAIEKLEQLKTESTQVTWSQVGAHGPSDLGVSVRIPISRHHDVLAYAGTAANAHLIVTLHRTIDAQLAILRAGRSACRAFPHVVNDRDLPGWAAEAKVHALAFADAILGGTQ